MKITIELDIEEIVRQEIRQYVRDNLEIKDVESAHVNEVQRKKEVNPNPPIQSSQYEQGYEFLPISGRRRSKTEISMHEKERELRRRLTPEEKGTITGEMEYSDSKELVAKELAVRKAKLTEIEKEVTRDIVEKHKAESTQSSPIFTEEEEPATTEEVDEIPKTAPLDNLNSLFN